MTVAEQAAISVGVFVFVGCIAAGIVFIFVAEWWENR